MFVCLFVCFFLFFLFFLSEGFFVLSFYRFPRVTLQLTVALFSSESVTTYFLIQCLKLIGQETKCFVPNFRVAIKQQKYVKKKSLLSKTKTTRKRVMTTLVRRHIAFDVWLKNRASSVFNQSLAKANLLILVFPRFALVTRVKYRLLIGSFGFPPLL